MMSLHRFLLREVALTLKKLARYRVNVVSKEQGQEVGKAIKAQLERKRATLVRDLQTY